MAGVVLIVVAAVGLVAYAFASDWWSDINRPGSTAIRVGDTKYSVRHYAERVRQYVDSIGGAEGQAGQNPQIAMQIVSEEIEEEALVLAGAPDLGVTADDNEIKAEIATILGLTGPDDPTFDSRLAEEVKNSKISESQFRDRARAAVLKRKAQEKFKAEVPGAAEAVHYRELTATDQTDADGIVARVQGGTDFAQIATEKGVENGGDKGWAPRGLLDKAVEDKLFALEPGGLTTHENEGGPFLVYQVLEKQADRPVEDAQKTTISDNTYERWLDEKRNSLKVENEVTSAGCDAKKVKWVLDHAVPSPNNGFFSESLCA
jgi:peptidyl-prolyl cis-trans isomerase C